MPNECEKCRTVVANGDDLARGVLPLGAGWCLAPRGGETWRPDSLGAKWGWRSYITALSEQFQHCPCQTASLKSWLPIWRPDCLGAKCPSYEHSGAKWASKIAGKPFGAVVFVCKGTWRPGSLGAKWLPRIWVKSFGADNRVRAKRLWPRTHWVPNECEKCRTVVTNGVVLARGVLPLGAGVVGGGWAN